MQRDFIRITGGGLLAAGLSSVVLGQESGDATRRRPPNIILVLADDASAKEYTCYGGKEIQTPFLDSMARDGVRFRTAWAAPVCGPARSMLLTGRYNERTGMGSNSGSRQDLLKQPQLARTLRDSGYATALFGKLHHGGLPKEYGFDEHCFCRWWDGYTGASQRRSATKTGQMYAIQWYWHAGLVANGKGVPTTADDFGPEIECEQMIAFINRNRDRPFFVFWATNLPHPEFREKDGSWVRPDVPVLNDEGLSTGKRVAGSLASNLAYLDAKLARVARQLDKLGLRQNTVFIYTADNGSSGYGKGKAISDRALKVPFVVSGPGVVSARGARDELIDFTDIFPTLTDLAGVRTPEGLDGRSFAPLLQGKAYEARQWIHSSGELQEKDEKKERIGQWIRDRRWLLDADGQLWDCEGTPDTGEHRQVPSDEAGAGDIRERLRTLVKWSERQTR